MSLILYMNFHQWTVIYVVHCHICEQKYNLIYRVWLIKNIPNFAVMLYGLTVEFKQKEMTILKSNHS